jgi:hypothetical protein
MIIAPMLLILILGMAIGAWIFCPLFRNWLLGKMEIEIEREVHKRFEARYGKEN